MKPSVSHLINDLSLEYSSHADEEKARQMSAYMKNLFPFYGLQNKDRKALSKAWLKEAKTLERQDLWNLNVQLWEADAREMQYTALDLMPMIQKHPEAEDLPKIEWLVLNKSWWDTVDALAGRSMGAWFTAFPDQIETTINRWCDSGELWLIRSALLFQLFYKDKTDTKLLFELCTRYAAEKEFFIRKGIGWALRQYAKTDADLVCNYVKKHPELSGLSKREALKNLPDCQL